MRHTYPLELKSAQTLETKEAGDNADPVLDAVKRLEQSIEEKTATFASADELKALRAEIASLKRPGAGHEENEAAQTEAKSFLHFVRRGVERLSPEEVKALRVSDNTAGGYLAPEEFVRELDRNLVEFSPIRQAARVSATASGSVILPKRTAGLTASWVDETEERPSTQPTYGSTTLTVGEIAAYVDVSNSLLEDSAFDLASELAFDFAEEFGQSEGTAFVTGNGVKKPLGFMNASLTSVNSGGASSFDFDSLKSLFYALPGAYARRAVWGMNRTTMGVASKLKGTDGHYIWKDAVAEGDPPTILGRPVIEMPDMPDVAGGAYPVVLGDFTHFRIFDRVALSILRDPFSQATEGKTRFHGRRRVAAGVTKAEAFRTLKIAA